MTEKNESTELKGWRFVATETSAGVYLVEAWKGEHRFVSIRGSDYDEILHECRQSAIEIAKRLESAPE